MQRILTLGPKRLVSMEIGMFFNFCIENRPIGSFTSLKIEHKQTKNTPIHPCCEVLKSVYKQKDKESIIMERIREIESVVFKALTLAMGVAVVALSKLGNLDVQTAVSLLGIGVACAGIALLSKQ